MSIDVPPGRPPVGGSARTIGWIAVGLAVAVVVAAFLPWVEVLGITVTGIGGDDVGGTKDGVLTLLCALVVAVLGLLRGLGKAPLAAAIVALVMGLLIALIAVVDIADVSDLRDTAGVDATVGVGLWLTLVGGVGLIAVGITGIVRRR